MDNNSKKYPLGPAIIVTAELEQEETLVKALNEAGFEVVLCKDPKRALTVIESKNERFRPAIFVVDVSLPGISGYELTRRLSEKYYERRIPIVIMSKYKSKEDELEATNVGAVGVIAKPLTAEALKDVLEKQKQRRAAAHAAESKI